jgi:hypothetical protein
MGILCGRDLSLGRESVECASFHAKYAMANDNKPQRGRADASARSKKVKAAAPTERPFDMWLQKQLHAMYDEIAAEPLPDDLLGLIERDAENKDKPPRKK